MSAKQPVSSHGGWVRTNAELTGKTVLITGANTGIGLETAIDLARRNARVLLACRSLERAENAKRRIVEESGSQNVIVKQLNLASFDSIRKLAADINSTEERLDILINNAGLLLLELQETDDGIEMHFGVNHLGHFLLTNLLIDILKRSAPSRIINVSSAGHQVGHINWEDPQRRKNFRGMDNYCQSKLSNILFSRELSKRLAGTGVTSNSLHPGVVKTEFTRNSEGCCRMGGCVGFLISLCFCCGCFLAQPDEGAQTTIYCAVAPELETVTGKYFGKCKIANEASQAKRDDDAKKLWEYSEKLTEMQTDI